MDGCVGDLLRRESSLGNPAYTHSVGVQGKSTARLSGIQCSRLSGETGYLTLFLQRTDRYSSICTDSRSICKAPKLCKANTSIQHIPPLRSISSRFASMLCDLLPVLSDGYLDRLIDMKMSSLLRSRSNAPFSSSSLRLPSLAPLFLVSARPSSLDRGPVCSP